MDKTPMLRLCQKGAVFQLAALQLWLAAQAPCNLRTYSSTSRQIRFFENHQVA